MHTNEYWAFYSVHLEIILIILTVDNIIIHILSTKEYRYLFISCFVLLSNDKNCMYFYH